MIKLKELKNGWQYNESFVPNDEGNTDYQQIKNISPMAANMKNLTGWLMLKHKK